MPHFYQRLTAMVLMSVFALGCAMYLPAFAASSGRGEVHYETPTLAEGEKVVLTADGESIGAREFSAYLIYRQALTNSQLSTYGMDESVWEDDFWFSRLPELAQEQAVTTRKVVKMFDKYGLRLTAEQREAAAQNKAAMIEQCGGQEGFEKRLAELGLTEQLFDNDIFCAYAIDRMGEYLYGANGIAMNDQKRTSALTDAGYLRAKQIFIKSVDANGDPLTGDALDAAKKKLQEVQGKLASGEDFDTLLDAYNEDGGMQSNPDGYLFTEGTYMTEFEDGVKSLAVGAISAEPVETKVGWHIIERLPIDKAYVENNCDEVDSKLELPTITDLVSGWAKAANVEKGPLYAEFTNANKWQYSYYPDHQ